MPVGIWPISKTIVEDSQQLVRYLDALRLWILSISGGGGVPANPNQSIQFNNAGAFGGSANLLYDSGTLSIITAGTSFRFMGDMSNATIVNRFAFMTTTVNGPTRVHAFPNGTGTTATFNCTNLADPTNANFVQIGATAAAGIIGGGLNGAGTPLELLFTNNTVNGFALDVNTNLRVYRGISTAVVSKTANYTILQNDHIIFADCTGGSFTLTLPAANVAGAGFSPSFRIKRTDASANTVTVARAGADTIDGAATVVLAARQALDLESDGVSLWGAM